MSTANRYPLSTYDGKAIPLDVVKPLAALSLPFTTTAFNSIVLNTNYEDKILSVYATEDCYISFLQVPTSLVDSIVSDDVMIVPAGVMLTFIANSIYISSKGLNFNGRLYIQVMDIWAGLALETQITRRS